MKICHVVHQYYPQSTRPRRAAETFAKLGHEVHVIAMRDVGQVPEEVLSGVRVHRLPFQVVRGSRLRYVYQYMTFLLESTVCLLGYHLQVGFEVIHVHSLPDFQILCSMPEKMMGARIVLDLHEAMPELFAARFRARMTSLSVRALCAVELLCCSIADRVLVVNETLRDRLAEHGLEGSRVAVIMNSPPLESLPRLVAEQPSKATSPSASGIIVYVGGVNQERDLDTLVEAVAKLSSRHSPKLVLVGPGDPLYLDRLRGVARDLGLTDFELVGHVPHDQAFSWMLRTDLAPITYESNPLTELAMPTKALEYAAARKPLVIADLKAVRRIFGDAAVYYRPGDSDDLAEKISLVLSDPALRKVLVTRAFEVLSSCSWDTMAERLAVAYASSPDRGV